MSRLIGLTVSLPEMLSAKERRQQRQKDWLNEMPDAVLIYLTLRIPGPVKTNSTIEAAFQRVVQEIRRDFGSSVLKEATWLLPTGPEAALALTGDAKDVKMRLMETEEKPGFYQLMDLDVLFNSNGEVRALSRESFNAAPRRCLVCGQDAKSCSRSRRHGLAAVQEVVETIIEQDEKL